MAEDYLLNGILHCGECGTPKETIVTIFGIEKKVPCLCECEYDAFKKDKDERIARQFEIEASIRRTDSILDGKLREASFENAEDSKNVQTCKKYAAMWDKMKVDNQGLLMWGDIGTGKTFCAACIANELISKGKQVLMTSFPRILNGGFDKREVVAKIQTYDLVIIDDLGTERKSPYAMETVFYVIDERYRAAKPLIVTTNLSLKEIKQEKDMDYKRIYDRVLEMCVPMNFSNDGYRPKISGEKLNEMNRLYKNKAGA